MLPRTRIPSLLDARGWFPSDQARVGLRYFFSARARRELAAEVRAQFTAFTATGLSLEHADAHKHMHLHPTIGRLMIGIGREFGLQAIRVPTEPPAVLAACGERVGLSARALAAWSRALRRQVRRAGMRAPDAVFGIAWSGRMTREKILALAPHLPAGVSELYFHPAARKDRLLATLMPDYRQEKELAALLDPDVARALAAVAEIVPGYGVTEGTTGGGGAPLSGSPGGPRNTFPGGPCSTSPGGPFSTSPVAGAGGGWAGSGASGTGT